MKVCFLAAYGAAADISVQNTGLGFVGVARKYRLQLSHGGIEPASNSHDSFAGDGYDWMLRGGKRFVARYSESARIYVPETVIGGVVSRS